VLLLLESLEAEPLLFLLFLLFLCFFFLEELVSPLDMPPELEEPVPIEPEEPEVEPEEPEVDPEEPLVVEPEPVEPACAKAPKENNARASASPVVNLIGVLLASFRGSGSDRGGTIALAAVNVSFMAATG